MTYQDALQRFRIRFFFDAVSEHGGDAGAAARALGVHRNTISRVLKGGGYPVRRVRKIIRQRQAASEPAARRTPSDMAQQTTRVAGTAAR